MKKFLALFLAALMLLSLVACASDGQTEQAPATDTAKETQSTQQTVPSTEEAPAEAEQTGSVLADINGDGIMEAFAFYSMTEDESTVMYVNAICSENGKWKSVAKQKIVAGGVDRVDFCDLDGDGISEILIGWEIYGTSEMQMAVYSFKNDELNRRMLQQYTHFLCGDIDEDGNNEITVIMINSGDTPNTATVYRLNENGVSELFPRPTISL